MNICSVVTDSGHKARSKMKRQCLPLAVPGENHVTSSDVTKSFLLEVALGSHVKPLPRAGSKFSIGQAEEDFL